MISEGKKLLCYDGERLHIVCGDANMCEIADYMKIGMTALVLDAIEDGIINHISSLSSTIYQFHVLSKDFELKQKIYLSNDKKISAIDIQRQYLLACQTYKGRDKITDDILLRWEKYLDALEKKDYESLFGVLDWVTKKAIIDNYTTDYASKEARMINLAYHRIHPKKGIFFQLMKKDLIERVLTDEQIKYAVKNPPSDTRAYLRGKMIQAEEKIKINEMNWDFIRFYYGCLIMDYSFLPSSISRDSRISDLSELAKTLEIKEIKFEN